MSLVSVLNLLYFYISTFRSVCAVPNLLLLLLLLQECKRGENYYYYYYYYYTAHFENSCLYSWNKHSLQCLFKHYRAQASSPSQQNHPLRSLSCDKSAASLKVGLSTECDIVLPLSSSSKFSFPLDRPVAVYAFFLLFSPVLSFLLFVLCRMFPSS